MRDYLYLWHNPSEHYLVASGIHFKDFLPLLAASGGVVLLRHEAADCQWDGETGLEYWEASSLPALVEEENIYSWGDCCWADFQSEHLPRLGKQELAELLYFGSTREKFSEVGLASLGNRFLAFAHDDGWYLKLYYTHWDHVSALLASLQLMAIRGEALAALANGNCAFWITADQVDAEEGTHRIDALMERRVWAHTPSAANPPAPTTLEEIAISLPNGFHDAYLQELTLDFENREARMDLNLWIGDLEAPEGADLERVRRAEITLSDIGFWISAPDGLDRDLFASTGLRIDIGLCGPNRQPKVPLPIPEENGKIYWLYCAPLNTLTYFTAASASLTWYS